MKENNILKVTLLKKNYFVKLVNSFGLRRRKQRTKWKSAISTLRKIRYRRYVFITIFKNARFFSFFYLQKLFLKKPS